MTPPEMPRDRTPPAVLRPELVILIGLPGSGKTTFAQSLAATHERVSGDLLRGRSRSTGDTQLRQVRAALASGRSVVLDNVHAARASRARWIALGHALGARVIACYLDVPKATCLARNRARPGAARVPDVAIHVAAARLAPPAPDEGFDEIRTLRPAPAEER